MWSYESRFTLFQGDWYIRVRSKADDAAPMQNHTTARGEETPLSLSLLASVGLIIKYT